MPRWEGGLVAMSLMHVSLRLVRDWNTTTIINRKRHISRDRQRFCYKSPSLTCCQSISTTTINYCSHNHYSTSKRMPYLLHAQMSWFFCGHESHVRVPQDCGILKHHKITSKNLDVFPVYNYLGGHVLCGLQSWTCSESVSAALLPLQLQEHCYNYIRKEIPFLSAFLSSPCPAEVVVLCPWASCSSGSWGTDTPQLSLT